MSGEFPKSATIEAEMKNTRKNTVYVSLYVCINKYITISKTYFNRYWILKSNYPWSRMLNVSPSTDTDHVITVPPKYLIYQYLIQMYVFYRNEFAKY